MLGLLKAASLILALIPLPIMLLLGRLLGSAAYRLDAKHRRIALENLELAYGDSIPAAEKERIARQVFRNLAMNLFEFARIPWLGGKDLERRVTFSGLEHLDSAFRKTHGVIMLASHFGNWELMAAFHALNGYPIDIVVRDIDSPLLNEFVRWVRTRPGNRIISKGRSMRKLLKCLAANRIAGILLDQNVARVEGVFVDFFGVPACTNKGPMLLAAASRAAVVPSFIIREGAGHRIVVCPEVKLADTGDKESDLLENTRRCTRVIEEMIRKHPDHWFWVHRRWKTRPEGEASPPKKSP